MKTGPEIVAHLKQELAKSGLKDEQILIICFNEQTVAESQEPDVEAALSPREKKALLWGGVTFVLIGVVLLAVSLAIGVLCALARRSAFLPLRYAALCYVEAVRGTPLLMVIFWAYFLLPTVTGHRTDQFSTMLTASSNDVGSRLPSEKMASPSFRPSDRASAGRMKRFSRSTSPAVMSA